MAQPVRLFALCIIIAGLFTCLFHGTGIGLNLLLFEVLTFAAVFATRRTKPTREVLLTAVGTLLTAVLVVVYGSSLALVTNVISVTLFIGVSLAPELGALHRSLVLACVHLVAAQRAFLRSIPFLGGASPRGITPRGVLSITLVPVVVLVFAGLYSASNPHFDVLLTSFWDLFATWDASLPFLFLFGLVLASFLLFITRHQGLLNYFGRRRSDLLAPHALPDEAHTRKMRGELRTGVALLLALNALLLLVNVLDVQHVWLSFQFEGQYLKQFVREGTYLLILSIFLGAFIVLYFFRNDLNFFARNRSLKLLGYLWLAQNVVLAISVGVRNYWYIHHYALAHKRIGVAFFLIATCIGLLLIMLKVHRRRTHHYLVRWNMLSVYCVVLVMALFDWDTIIARYNMAQRERAFVHLDFLATLADKTLPYLVRPQAEVDRIDQHNEQLLGGPERYSRRLYMRPADYSARIAYRVKVFTAEYPLRSWREWNWAEARAFRLLSATQRENALRAERR